MPFSKHKKKQMQFVDRNLQICPTNLLLYHFQGGILCGNLSLAMHLRTFLAKVTTVAVWGKKRCLLTD